VIYLGGWYPGWATDEWFRGVETSEQSTEGAKVVEPFALSEVWPAFTFSSEESQQVTTIGNDIAKYADESLAAFVTGERSLAEWDGLVETFERFRRRTYLAEHRWAYERRKCHRPVRRAARPGPPAARHAVRPARVCRCRGGVPPNGSPAPHRGRGAIEQYPSRS